MTKLRPFLLLGTIILGYTMAENPLSSSSLKETIAALRRKLVDSQSYIQQKNGLFSSDILINKYGNKENVLVRQLARFPDPNMFSTAIILQVLLELDDLDPLTSDEVKNMERSLDSIKDFKDVFTEGEHSVMCFWEYYKDGENKWSNTPTTMDVLKQVKMMDMSAMLGIIGRSGLDVGELYKATGILNHYERQGVWTIPADFDDTMNNIAIGALLKARGKSRVNLYDKWLSANTNATQSVIAALKKHAYRPLSDDSNVNTIGTKTYYWIRHFIQKRVEEGDDDIAIVPTWVVLQEDFPLLAKHNMHLVGLNNEIDLNVGISAILGITEAVLSGLWDNTVLDDKEFQNLYLDTLRLIVHQIRTNYSGHIEFNLVNYSSEFQFYWWISRIYSQMEKRLRTTGQLPHVTLYFVHYELKDVLRNVITPKILSEVPADEPEVAYFDDMLGIHDDDGTDSETMLDIINGVRHLVFNSMAADGKVDEKHTQKNDNYDNLLQSGLDYAESVFKSHKQNAFEDRIFTTSMAVNTLLSTWVYSDVTSGKLAWDSGTPDAVQSVTKKGVTWLNRHVLAGEYRPNNAFFTGGPMTRKYAADMYPYNVLNHMDGSNINGLNEVKNVRSYVIGVSGVIPPEKYDVMLNEVFGESRPVSNGFKDKEDFLDMCTFSSAPYTYATTVLALTKYQALM